MKDPIKIKAAKKRWRDNNKEKIAGIQRIYRKNNKELVREKRLNTYSMENSKSKEYRKKYYVNNKDKIRATQKLWDEKNKDRKSELARRSNLRKYGLTLEQYDEMRKEQKYKCFLCDRHENECRDRKLCVDHNHSTGQVRKLLCTKCNAGLGNFDENSEILSKAIEYLRICPRIM